MPGHDVVASTGAWILERGHRLLLALTGGRFPRTVMGMLTLELHTVGRKSGRPYSNLLTSPVHDEHRIVVVASKGGHSDHPDWYKNALANPQVRITVDGVDEQVRARPATPRNAPRSGLRWSGRTGATRATRAGPTARSRC
ncbi:Deazaflavin-dependent nitroreductase [Mycobacteroides chelonae]|nr:Deazaflavin-dependent nitroreductase [Mycobacteroides chelonae]